MATIERLEDKEQWHLFFEYKKDSGHMSKHEEIDLNSFIANEEYLPVVKTMKDQMEFSPPNLTVLNKKNSNKKRIVYTFSREENYVLKLITYILQEYDGCFAPNLYSFRKDKGVKKAVIDLISHKDIENCYSYKVDIRDYFNSVDVELLLPKLKKVLDEEQELYQFIEGLLRNPYAQKNGELIPIKKGIMAGTPISAFLANLYLAELDDLFWKKDVAYARYSDDIIVFARSREELEEYIVTIENILSKYKLEINSLKQHITEPQEKWEFLGFSYDRGSIDVSDIALEKVKGKLKRKARAIYRWKRRNNLSDERAVRAYIRYFSRKFFDNPIHNEITWCRWYFPVINTDATLHVIDRYMQDCIRYLATGKYAKSNYNLRYETIKDLGYKSLVNAYYKIEKSIRRQKK